MANRDDEDEMDIATCPICKVPLIYWWNNGVVRGEYVLIADWLMHPKCWDKLEADDPIEAEK